MTDICRLCLSVCPDPERTHNLFENSELVSKITSCLQLEILQVDLLPNQICCSCKDRINQIHSYLKVVLENQNILYSHLKSGKDCLDNFYLSLKTVKDEIKNNLTKVKEEEYGTENTETQIEIKQESNENNNEEGIEYSSDDDVLISFRSSQEKPDEKVDITFKDEQNNDSKKSLLETPLQKASNATDSIENIPNEPKTLEFECLMCLEVCHSRVNLTKHYQKAHQPTVPPTCDLNNYSTVNVNGETTFKCGMCEKTSSKREQIHKHIRNIHEKSRPYTCRLCGRTYRRITEIIQHLRAHNGINLFCSYKCGYSSVYSAGLKTHEKTHRNEYKYKCETCGKCFEVRTWYEEHQYIHTGAKPFVCNICGLAYPFKRYLVRHQTDNHPVAEPPSENTKFVCVHCSVPCDTKMALKRHLFKVHGEKQTFLCDVCGKVFNRNSNLVSHTKHHAGVRNYTCSTCNKSFVKRSGLRRHELTHIGEQKKHACSDCGKRYVEKSALHKHQLRFHSLPASKCPDMKSNE